MKTPKVKFPFEVSEGFAKVNIYRLAPTGGSIKFSVDYRLDGKRHRQAYANWEEAKLQATTIAHKLASGDAAALQLTGDDQRIYLRASETLRPIGIALDSAAIRFVEAFKALGSDMVVEACREYARRHPTTMPKRTIQEVVVELVDAKRLERLSEKHVQDLQSRCGAFAAVFVNTQIATITPDNMREYLQGLRIVRPGQKAKAVSPRTFQNHYGALVNMFAFAKDHGYVPKDFDAMDSIKLPKDVNGEIEIFTPSELALIFQHARPALVPFIAIAAFAGVRSAELERLDWSNINTKFITLDKSITKTSNRRLVPIGTALSQWLEPYRQATGDVVTFKNMAKQIGWLVDKINIALKAQAEKDGKALVEFKWKHNALRHSFISYRVAETQNVAQTSLEAGNSPRMIFSNYLELVQPDEAKAWFNVLPERPANVVAISQAAAAQ
jgi:integrase